MTQTSKSFIVSPNEVFERFLAANAIPLVDIAKQIIHPWLADKKIDAKDQKATSDQPLFTRHEAYTRLCLRFQQDSTEKDHLAFQAFIQQIQLRYENEQPLLSYEHLLLGLAYFNGMGVNEDYDLAIQHCTLANKTKDPYALTTLGWIYFEIGRKKMGNPVDNDLRGNDAFEAAYAYAAQAISCEIKVGSAHNLMGKLYKDFPLFGKSQASALKQFKLAAKLEDASGMLNLAILSRDQPDTMQRYLIQAIEFDYLYALVRYAIDIVKPVEPSLADKICRAAKERGSEAAIDHLKKMQAGADAKDPQKKPSPLTMHSVLNTAAGAGAAAVVSGADKPPASTAPAPKAKK